METVYSPWVRTERLIVVAPALLAFLSLLVMQMDPYEPSKYSGIIHALLALYPGYSMLMIPLVWASSLRVKIIGLITHIIDVAIFTALVYFTEGTNSPFFSYFIFAMFCAALRWQKAGTLWTALAFLCLFIGMGISMEFSQYTYEFQRNHFIIRSVYLVTIAMLLVYLTAYEKRVRNELSKLHNWPSNTNTSSSPQAFYPGSTGLRGRSNERAALADDLGRTGRTRAPYRLSVS